MKLELNLVKEKVKQGGRKLKNLSLKKKILFGGIAILLVAAIVLGPVLSRDKAQERINTAHVDRGNISVVISGTGTIEPIDEYEVTSLVKGEILSDTFEEGDMVEKGDLLYQIDSSDLESNLEKAQLNLEKSRLSYNQTMDELSKLEVTSPYSGTITEMYIKEGDSVNNGAKVAALVDMDTMLLSVPFNENDAGQISVGSQAEVVLSNSFYRMAGQVRRISSGTLISDEGVLVRTVEIEVTNPGTIGKGDTATAMVGTVACNGPGTFDYNVETTITAETSGKVTSLYFGKGDRISGGSVLASLSSPSSATTRTNSQLSLRDSQLSIENYYKQLEDYRITAPISGTVLKKTSKAGDTLDNSNAQVVMAVIADMSTIIFEMSVDELDISKIEVGQSVSVTADAIEGRIYKGYVDYVSVVGTTQNGVTTYPIRVVVENPEDLIPGMNVSAEIVVESREDVLRVPVTAVNRGNIVYVKDEGVTDKSAKDEAKNEAPMGRAEGKQPQGEEGQSDSENRMTPAPEKTAEFGGDDSKPNESSPGMQGMLNMKDFEKKMQAGAPDGFRAVRVETGLNDSDYIEIISGLSEGDEVYMTVSQKSSTDQQMFGMMGMGGGMPGGGMPGGGMPGGGMAGGGR